MNDKREQRHQQTLVLKINSKCVDGLSRLTGGATISGALCRSPQQGRNRINELSLFISIDHKFTLPFTLQNILH